MKEYIVKIPVDYVDGHLRYGHLEGIVKVKDENELKELIDNKEITDYLSIVIDDYRVNGYGDAEFDNVEYEELETKEVKDEI